MSETSSTSQDRDILPDNDRLSRREFLKNGARAVTSLALAQATAIASQRSTAIPATRPNFVFVMTNGHRPSALSLMANPIVQTPNFDRIGREGAQLRQAFVINSLCLPSRATALTGLYSHATGCIDNGDRAIPAQVPMFTDVLRAAGYEVALFGKAHVKDLGKRYWDYYFGFPSAATDYFWPQIEQGARGAVQAPQTFDGYVDDVVTSHALEWVKEKREKPFCLLLWMQSPHAPFFRARRHLDLYNGVPIPKPATFDDDLKGYPGKPRAFADADNKIGTYALHSQTRMNSARSLEEVTKDYYAGIVLADENMGKTFEALTTLGVLDDTVILFTADHGFFLGEWRMYDKRFMHEPSIRVPLFIRYPRLIKPGTVVADKMTLNLDWAPTILDFAGVPVPSQMQGRSLVPLLQGEQPANWRKEWLYEYYEYPGPHNVKKNRGIRTDRYKLMHYYEEPQEFELYDLQEDPGELRNLYADARYASLTRELLARIDELRKETGDLGQPPTSSPAATLNCEQMAMM
jgi:arylsulfatase A-like enzyme